MSSSSSMIATFVAALRAVGTATTMAAAGFYLHRRGLMTAPGQKMMALISQQVTIPAFLFARIIYCPKGSSSSSSNGGAEGVCPSVADRLSDLWMLLLWPIYVVVCGLITGYIAARISRTPTVQIRSCLAACAFPNSTGMVITLLTVIHDQFSSSTELGRIDPTAFLSVYMLMYPVLQWGVGGWLLASDGDDHGAKTKDLEETTTKEVGNNIYGIVTEASPLLIPQSQPQDAFSFVQQPSSQTGCDENGNNCIATATRRSIKHILNMEPRQLSPSRIAGQEEFGDVIGTAHHRHHHIRLNRPMKHEESHHWISTGYIDTSSSSALDVMVRELSFSSSSRHDSDEIQAPPNLKKIRYQNGSSVHLLPHPESELENHHHHQHDGPIEIHASLEVAGTPSREQIRTMQGADILPLTETLLRIASKVFQPPVIASLLGLFIASVPELRGLFENIWGNKGSEAPFKFAFDGIYAIGQAAVPMNMMILGVNLSSTYQKKKKTDVVEYDPMRLSNITMLAVVIGKMIVMPVIGIVSTWFFQRYYMHLPDEIDATCYLVMMITFITPTANNVMVMVELSGSSSKEGMARLIGWQYAISPVVLSIVLSAVVSLASCHFDSSFGEDCSM